MIYPALQKKSILVFINLCLAIVPLFAHSGFNLIKNNQAANVYYGGSSPVVETALEILDADAKQVGQCAFKRIDSADAGAIIIGELNDPIISKLIKDHHLSLADINAKWEAFYLKVIQMEKIPTLLVVGSDARGTAYGVMEISRKLGVSPWSWWADVVPRKQSTVSLAADFEDRQSPKVQFRGIFLNDEDWGLTPWSSQTYEPEATLDAEIDPAKTKKMATIGPKTYARIFELLLRLRANSIWPAMHEVTVPFYFVQGNREMAEKYGIYIGSSHCEPLARNSATEWDIVGKGPYNYLTNKKEIVDYWSNRLKTLGQSHNIFTLGMRGKHDGAMEGVKTTAAYKDALNQVLQDQTDLLKKYVNSDPAQIPQVVIPYKEVLDVYRAGIAVPDYATLMWCDDNYGYVTHFPDQKERKRAGGNGLYYHISYWGRPHDYLWLSTMSPALIYQQLSTAYQHDVRKMWIVNVGDIKPAEYQIELLMDMAWNIDQVQKMGINQHMNQFLQREFGHRLAKKIGPIMQEHYRLAHIRKPEFMGNTRTEEKDPAYKLVKDLPWSEQQIQKRLVQYKHIQDAATSIWESVPLDRKDAYFELVLYPVVAAAKMNEKHLYAQLARHGKAEWQKSHDAYDKIVTLTAQYNLLNKGKWKGMMDYKPRNLAVFDKIVEEKAVVPMVNDDQPVKRITGKDLTGSIPYEGLGYQGQAAAIPLGVEASYRLKGLKGDSVTIVVHLLPAHPVSSDDLRFEVSLGQQHSPAISYKTVGRSEEWKENVLRNQAIRTIKFKVTSVQQEILRIKALDEGVVVDEVTVYLD
ncbi:glycosyl hydrolase 115 family protein [Sphingobacterium thalpophilum]|uniref:glycosyl hydrolase 115 family protein n=1 Tax=Sphingobacterium thalpophilum TaxID=259 RepID=UPI0031D7B428